jgi:hypothetical protein
MIMANLVERRLAHIDHCRPGQPLRSDLVTTVHRSPPYRSV